ncbi:gb [Venturia nashicola]|uniref:Gb n=1 Tax=Venturia nashicola TaxID=86259 RepID=A0A4Z1NZP4_9PEZI|nr:gb [Venturia nashicola]TLD32408.1 gb [Venturia nashicola]
MAGYARVMADSLAMMHWLAKVDANDVEFVLASPRLGDPLEATFTSVTLEQHALWILDFDCCNSMSMDETGVDQAVAAFFKNDPFYPRPGSENTHDQEMWKIFGRDFSKRGLRCLGTTTASLISLDSLWTKSRRKGRLAERGRKPVMNVTRQLIQIILVWVFDWQQPVWK